jgi:hypothetical protein
MTNTNTNAENQNAENQNAENQNAENQNDEMHLRLWAAVAAAQGRGDATHRPENRTAFAMILYMAGINQGLKMFTPGTPARRAYYEAQCEGLIARLDALTPTPDAHPCGWAVADEHNAHYAGACACYG